MKRVLTFALWCCFGGVLSWLVTWYQPLPYMDEIFHVPQTVKYCARNFTSWDPMITTFPGLYVIAAGIAEIVSYLLQISPVDVCTNIWILRLVNSIFFAATRLVIEDITAHLSMRKEVSQVFWRATALSVFPLHFFFHFIFYTDPGSTFFVLLCYALSIRRLHLASGIAGLAAVFFRQTNVVWVAFVAFVAILRDYETVTPSSQELPLGQETLRFVQFVLGHIGHVLRRFSVFLITAVSFVIFVLWNKGIVVGDRTSHKPTLHVPQLYYCISFVLFMGNFHFVRFSLLKRFLKSCSHAVQSPKALFVGSSMLTVAVLSIRHFTLAHPYLLADNRHYTFYVWKNIYRKHEFAKYALVPVYAYGLWSINFRLEESKRSALWRAAFYSCCAMVLIPAALLEFRYFIIPFFIIALNTLPPTAQSQFDVGFYLAINAATLLLFLLRPFAWPNGELCRFMW